MTQDRARRLGAWITLAGVASLVVLGEFFVAESTRRLMDRVGGVVYAAILGASTSLLGFMITTLAIAAGMASLPRAEFLKERGLFSGVYLAFLEPVKWLAGLSLASIIGLFAFDQTWVLYLTALLLGLAIAPMVYALRVLRGLLDAVSRPDSEEKPTASEDYDRP